MSIEPKPILPTAPAAHATHGHHVAQQLGQSGAATGLPTETAITVRGFSSWYGSFQALKSLDLDIPARQVTAFIGPSGCGKSTFLRWINRMNDTIPSARAEGTLDLHGEDLLSKSLDVVDLRRRVGMVFQKPNPFPKSIYDNVAFGPRLHKHYTRAELDQLVEQSLRSASIWSEVKELRRANEILKLASAFFAQAELDRRLKS